MKYIFYGVLFCCFIQKVSSQESPLEIENVITISTQQAKRLYDLNTLFIDIRTKDQWTFGRIERSHNFDLRFDLKKFLESDLINKNKPVVIYGNSIYHIKPAIASYLLSLRGVETVFFFRDGYYSWLAMDYPVTLFSDQQLLVD